MRKAEASEQASKVSSWLYLELKRITPYTQAAEKAAVDEKKKAEEQKIKVCSRRFGFSMVH